MEAEMTYLLEEQARKLENAEMLIERLKREVMALSFSVELHDRAAKKVRAIWEEAHPDESEEWLRREDLMVWMMERIERYEAVKESLTSALHNIKEISDEWNLSDYKRISDLAETALRTAEESSVVDSTSAKQPEDSANADEDVESLIDEEVGGMTHTCERCRKKLRGPVYSYIKNGKRKKICESCWAGLSSECTADGE